MSKNERMFRTVIVGFVFLGLGLFSMVAADRSTLTEKGTRNLATIACEVCGELSRLKTELSKLPTSESETRRPRKMRIEVREAKILRAAGTVMMGLFKNRQATEEELQSVTRFLVETSPRDGAGIALDVISEELPLERMNQTLSSIEGEITTLTRENVFTAKEAEQYRAFIAAFRSQGDAENK